MHLERETLFNIKVEKTSGALQKGSIPEEFEQSPDQDETELVPSVSEPENLNELGLDDKENPSSTTWRLRDALKNGKKIDIAQKGQARIIILKINKE